MFLTGFCLREEAVTLKCRSLGVSKVLIDISGEIFKIANALFPDTYGSVTLKGLTGTNDKKINK